MMVVVYILKSLLHIRLVKYSCLFLLLICTNISFSQSNDLEKLKDLRVKYSAEIDNAQKLLMSNDQSRKNYLKELRILNSKISAQENIIATYNKEIDQISAIIASNDALVQKLNIEINEIRNSYEKLIIEANKHYKSDYNEFMILFSAKTFSEAYRRFNLMKQYSSYRKRQGLILIETKQKHDSIILVNKVILQQKQESYKLLLDEIEAIKISASQKKSYVSKLQKEEAWLKEEIASKKKASDELEKSIEKLIHASVAKSSDYSFSNFAQAKGKLLWPVKDGIVTSNFGEHNHAVLKGVKVKNNGVDITAAKENDVKCVYEGTVSRVIAIPGYNKAVIIRHGKYLTVYANLVRVYVKSGDSVKSDQSIGQIYAETNDKSGILHFEIWEENNKINPLNWLSE